MRIVMRIPAFASPAALVFALSALLVTTTATAQPAGIRERGIRLLDLGTLGGAESSAWDIDENGRVVGWSQLPSGARRAFVSCADCTMQDLGTHIGGNESISRAVSSNGQWVAGSSGINAFGPGFAQFTQGFVFNGGTMTSVNALYCSCTLNARHGISEAYGVNDHGTVVGWAPVLRANYHHAFMWKDGVIQDISEMDRGDPSWSRAYDINNAEQIVGYIDRDDDLTFSEGDREAFIWQDGAFRTLDHLPGYTSSTAVAINETGLVVGWSGDVTGSVSRAALWSGARVTELATLGSDINSQALDVNDRGQVVGWSSNAAGETRAVFWQDSVVMDLNSLLPAGSGWQLIEARGINNRGMVVGTARINGELRAFVLIPPSAQRLGNEARN
jgi:probable HAF family extracellular repeat protein